MKHVSTFPISFQQSKFVPFLILCFLISQSLFSQNISGIWQGVAYQPFGGSTDCYPVTLYLVQTGNQLSGSSYTYVEGTPFFAEMNVVGSVSGNAIQYKENFIIDKKDVPGFEWCLGYGNLTYDPSLERIKGTLKGNTPSGSVCEEAILEVYRLQIISPLTYCQSGTYTLQVVGQDVKWYADKDLKQLIATGNIITRTISQNTTFYITQTTQYCSTPSPAAALEVKISDLALGPPTVVQPTCLAGGNLQFSATGGKPPYQFSLNGSTFQNEANFLNLPSGNYTLVVRDAQSCERTLTFTLDAPPAPAVSAAASPADCQNNGTATATGTGGTPPYQFLWSNGNTSNTLQNVPSGNFWLTLTDANGCTTSTSVTIEASKAVPVLKFSVEKAGCQQPAGSIVTAIDGGKTPYNFQWSNGSQAKDLQQLAHGTYFLTVTDSAGCSVTAAVEVPASESVALSFLEDTIFLNVGESVRLTPMLVPSGQNLDKIVWSPTQNLSCTDCMEPILSASKPIFYTVQVSNSDGCTATASVWVVPRRVEQAQVFVPNVFSPNDDGVDDDFGAFFNEGVQFLRLQVFDRWGNLVFESQHPDHRWDGKWRGKPLPADVFAYVLKFQDLKSHQEMLKTGSVAIIR